MPVGLLAPRPVPASCLWLHGCFCFLGFPKAALHPRGWPLYPKAVSDSLAPKSLGLRAASRALPLLAACPRSRRACFCCFLFLAPWMVGLPPAFLPSSQPPLLFPPFFAVCLPGCLSPSTSPPALLLLSSLLVPQRSNRKHTRGTKHGRRWRCPVPHGPPPCPSPPVSCSSP